MDELEMLEIAVRHNSAVRLDALGICVDRETLPGVEMRQKIYNELHPRGFWKNAWNKFWFICDPGLKRELESLLKIYKWVVDTNYQLALDRAIAAKREELTE